MMASDKVSSPSRTYVAVCIKINFDGHYLRKFQLPRMSPWTKDELANNARVAAWYFLNALNSTACIEGCVTFEDYQDLANQEDMNRKRDETWRDDFQGERKAQGL